ncbi:uncharacterized protein LOC108025051 [Drosophila biarmipes]|uniref:uncharacterized protein LOC108025051 n=1 Tax=Drosophila biarmipes TaxID=125945 RepID=UPI0007E7C92E|nr:uncharacterized protein LOC108025051 [Drosophila biarmipes]
MFNVYCFDSEAHLDAEMSSYWPKEERSFCSWEKIEAEQDYDTIIIDDDDDGSDSYHWRRKMKSESPFEDKGFESPFDDKGSLSPQDDFPDHKPTGPQPAKQKTNKKNPYQMRKTKVQLARHILARIAKNEAEGRTHPKDAKDKVRCQAMLKKLERHSRRNTQDIQPTKPMPDRSVVKNGRTPPKRSRRTGPSGSGKLDEEAKDNLVMALVDELHEDGYLLNQKWEEIETRLANMVTDRLMAVPDGPIPCFDSSDVIRGHRVIRCEDGFSKIFLSECVDEIGDSWDGLRIRLVHVSEIPWRPRARIWLPKGQRDHNRILSCLRAQNLDIDMSDWSILTAEQEMKTSQSFSFLINRRCLPQLEAAGYKVRYGIRMAKLKVFSSESDELPMENEELKTWRHEDAIPHFSNSRLSSQERCKRVDWK